MPAMAGRPLLDMPIRPLLKRKGVVVAVVPRQASTPPTRSELKRRLISTVRKPLHTRKEARVQTTILEVGGMLSVLDPQGVEKQLKRMPGVHAASVNIATNTAVIEYDETITNVEALRAKITECGFHCRGEMLPHHTCAVTPTASVAVTEHVDPATKRVHHATVSAPRTSAVDAGHERRFARPPSPTISHGMAHEMGHGAGMDMQQRPWPRHRACRRLARSEGRQG
jgi:copper chaperone CopZ